MFVAEATPDDRAWTLSGSQAMSIGSKPLDLESDPRARSDSPSHTRGVRVGRDPVTELKRVRPHAGGGVPRTRLPSRAKMPYR